MASLCQQHPVLFSRTSDALPFAGHTNNGRAAPSSSVSFWRDLDRIKWRICSAKSAVTAVANTARGVDRGGYDFNRNNKNKNIKGEDVDEKVDKWMEKSVVEIVKNLKEAPLLVQVFDRGDETTSLRTEKSVQEERWGAVKNKWVKRENPMPEGVIFVEQLMDTSSSEKDEITRAWGVVVQGRGVECGPVCYLLKTSRVASGGLGGVCCTHYCLMRVQSFRESAVSQLTNCWLIKG